MDVSKRYWYGPAPPLPCAVKFTAVPAVIGVAFRGTPVSVNPVAGSVVMVYVACAVAWTVAGTFCVLTFTRISFGPGAVVPSPRYVAEVLQSCTTRPPTKNWYLYATGGSTADELPVAVTVTAVPYVAETVGEIATVAPVACG